jgi:Holliday junction resolvase RusA-like endonuclease
MPTQISFTVYAHPEQQGSMRGIVLPNKNAITELIPALQARMRNMSTGELYKAIFRVCQKSRVFFKSENDALGEYRHKVAKAAKDELWNRNIDDTNLLAGKQVPVEMNIVYYLERPASAKKRIDPSVFPDKDKLDRAVFDSLTGVLYEDDSQVVISSSRKEYGAPERVEISFTVLEEARLF